MTSLFFIHPFLHKNIKFYELEFIDFGNYKI